MTFHRHAVLGLGLVLALAASSNALTQQYCSSENTGSDYGAVYNIYQSNGACQDQCKSDYAFAVVQYQNCWCTNYVPADQQSVSNCNENCPGYPYEQCGNESEGLFGYVALTIQPSGTEGAAASTQASSTVATSASTEPVSTSTLYSSSTTTPPTTTDSPTTSSTPTTVSITSTFVTPSVVSTTSTSLSSSTSTSQPRTSILTSYSSQSSTEQASSVSTTPTSTSTPVSTPTSTSQLQTSYTSPTTTPTPTSTTSSISTSSTLSTSLYSVFVYSASSSSSTSAVVPVAATTQASSTSKAVSMTPSPVTSVMVVTISGAIVTQTVTSTPMVSSNPESVPVHRKGVSGGAIAGGIIGALIAVAAIIFGAILLRRRRKQAGNVRDESTGRGANKRFRRNASVMSKTGLLLGRPASINEKEADEPLYINTHTGNNSVRHSMMLAPGTRIGEDESPVSLLGRHDVEHDSARRHSRPLVYDQRLNPSVLFANADGNGSRVSMMDQQDYSRPLGVVNKDQRASIDSRNS